MGLKLVNFITRFCRTYRSNLGINFFPRCNFRTSKLGPKTTSYRNKLYYRRIVVYTGIINSLIYILKNLGMIWFSWSVSETGYEVHEGTLIAKSPPRVKAVVRLKDDFAENICLDFVALDSNPENICNFANQYGFLQKRSLDSESLFLWAKEIKAIRDVLLAANEGRFADAMDMYAVGYSRQSGARAGFVSNVTKSDMEFRCVALDFASWLWLQIGHNLRGRQVATCRECGGLFFKGGGKRSRRAQSRRTKQFCTVGCKTAYNNRISTQRKKFLEKIVNTTEQG